MRNKSACQFTSPTAEFLGELGPEVERVDVARDSSFESDDSYSCGGDWQLFGIGGIVWQMKETLAVNARGPALCTFTFMKSARVACTHAHSIVYEFEEWCFFFPITF